jgi:hypothetical protein
LYARILLATVNGRWQEAVADTAIQYHATGTSMAIGAASVWILAVVVTLIVIHRAARTPTAVLLRGEGAQTRSPGQAPRQGRVALVTGLVCVIVGAAVAAYGLIFVPDNLTGPFFGVGALLLTGSVGLLLSALKRLGGGLLPMRQPMELAVGALARRPARTTAVFALVASGCFLLFAVAGMTKDVSAKADLRTSGTGGFDLFAESAIPIRPERTVEHPAGVFFAALADRQDFSYVPMRKRDGDDASCLNLNAAPQPQILAVDPARMKALGAFESAEGAPSVWDRLVSPRAEEQREAGITRSRYHPRPRG